MESYLNSIHEIQISHLVVSTLNLRRNYLLYCLIMIKIFGQSKHKKIIQLLCILLYCIYLFPFIPYRSANFLASRLQQHLMVAAAPPPGVGTRVNVWKADPSVKKIGIRELFLLNTDIKT